MCGVGTIKAGTIKVRDATASINITGELEFAFVEVPGHFGRSTSPKDRRNR